MSVAGDFPVQNGKAEFFLELGGEGIDPNCSPPMTLLFSDVTVADETNGLTD